GAQAASISAAAEKADRNLIVVERIEISPPKGHERTNVNVRCGSGYPGRPPPLRELITAGMRMV
ncbi:MAG TPA: hypothetical protein PLC98_07910, partial [Anaerolineales bacterium]|nr:hypothetical protein [Anaerolineales bacterium]